MSKTMKFALPGIILAIAALAYLKVNGYWNVVIEKGA